MELHGEEAGPALTAGGPHLALQTRMSAAMGLALEGPDPLLMACDQEVVQTIIDSRAPSTRSLYVFLSANDTAVFAVFTGKEAICFHFKGPLLWLPFHPGRGVEYGGDGGDTSPPVFVMSNKFKKLKIINIFLLRISSPIYRCNTGTHSWHCGLTHNYSQGDAFVPL